MEELLEKAKAKDEAEKAAKELLKEQKKADDSRVLQKTKEEILHELAELDR